MRLNRWVPMLLPLVLLAGCTTEVDDSRPGAVASADVEESGEGSPSAAPSPLRTVAPKEDCRGFGRVPRQGQITFFENYELRAAAPSGDQVKCLAQVGDLGGNIWPPVWNAAGDGVLLGNRALARDGSLTRALTDRSRVIPQWSRPSGSSVVYLSRGALMKRSSAGGDAVDISFLDRHDAVVYHPAGTHIATSGVAENGDYGLYLATNLGTRSQLLARGEAARFIHNLYFTEDGRYLYYSAQHGPHEWHLHRLGFGEDARLETFAVKSADFDYEVSSFAPDAVAWFVPGDCAAGEAGRFRTAIDLRLTAALRSTNIRPIGWLPGGELVVLASTTSCSTAQPGDIYVLSVSHGPMLIQTENYGDVSVRVAMPPPPPPPGKEQRVVA